MRFDELNVARLGLISIHERIPADYTKWEVRYDLEGSPARLSCIAHAEFGGVPHGLDNDISGALIALFIEAGAPENGAFQTTAYRVLQRSGLDTSGRYYAALQSSLQRLKTATFRSDKSWYDTRRSWVSEQFNYIESLEYSSDGDELKLSSTSLLRIRLGQPIVASIRAHYLKPLDETLLSKLERPLTRALYRLLDAKRYDPGDPKTIAVAFEVSLVQWAHECKILDLKPARIRRTLDGAHEELLGHAYLRSVTYHGRGLAQVVTYVFGDGKMHQEGFDALTDALRKYRVTRPAAEKLIETYGGARVHERLRKFEYLLRGGVTPKNPSGMLVDVIKDDVGKYADPEDYTPADVHEAAPQPAPAHVPADAPSEDHARRYELEQRARPFEEQIDAAIRTAQFIFGERLGVQDFARLRAKFSVGLADPFEFSQQVSRAAMERRLDALATQLKTFVSQ